MFAKRSFRAEFESFSPTTKTINADAHSGRLSNIVASNDTSIIRPVLALHADDKGLPLMNAMPRSIDGRHEPTTGSEQHGHPRLVFGITLAFGLFVSSRFGLASHPHRPGARTTHVVRRSGSGGRSARACFLPRV